MWEQRKTGEAAAAGCGRRDARPRSGDQETRSHTPEQQQQRQATFPRDSADSRVDRVDQSTQSITETIESLLLPLLLSLLLLRLPLLLQMLLARLPLARHAPTQRL